MKKAKPTPSVTDVLFDIRTPAFLVVHGYVIHWMAVDRKREQFLLVGSTVTYNRHGKFEVCCIHQKHAVIKHTTLSGKTMPLIVPEEKWLNVSNGSYTTTAPDYSSFEEHYKHLVNRIDQSRVNHSTELADKYQNLFDGFRGYWKENFNESAKEDNDLSTFMLGARIRYGMTCIGEGQPIPTDCKYEVLVKEVDEWIEYREGKFD